MATPPRRPPSRPIPKPPAQAPVAHVPAPEPVAPVVDELGLGVQADGETDLQEGWSDIAMPGAEQASEQEPAQAFTQESIDAAFAEAPEQQEGEQESEQTAVPDPAPELEDEPAPFPPGYTPRTMEEQTRLEQWCGRQHHRQHLARRAAEMAPPNNE